MHLFAQARKPDGRLSGCDIPSLHGDGASWENNGEDLSRKHSCNCSCPKIMNDLETFPETFQIFFFSGSVIVYCCCVHYTVGVTKHWHWLTGGVVVSPSLGIFKNCLDMVLGILL